MKSEHRNILMSSCSITKQYDVTFKNNVKLGFLCKELACVDLSLHVCLDSFSVIAVE